MGTTKGTTGGTLGDLLYADRTRRRALERDWVDLVRAIAERDQYALRALYQRTNRIVFTLILRLTGDRETAQEVLLDVFYDVWTRASQYNAASGSVIAWIMNQARSRAIDRLRFEHRRKRVNPYPDDPRAAPSPEGPQEARDVSEQQRLLHDALRVLTPDEREAIEVAYFSELTHAQVAARLNEPLGTIKTRIRSGLGKLRQALAGEGPAR